MRIVWYASRMLRQTSIDEGRGVTGHVEHSYKSMDIFFSVQATKTGYKSKEALDKSRSFMSVRAAPSLTLLSNTYLT